MSLKNILNLTLSELEPEIISIGEPKYRAKQIFTSLHKKNINTAEGLQGIPKLLKEKIGENFFIPSLKLLEERSSESFNTKKFLFQTERADKEYVFESVLISEKERNTICISTQIGCNVGCEFCATAKMGFIKNLEPAEIIMQVYEIIRCTEIMPTNLVFMGMGEPFLNYANLMKALKILTDKEGLGIPSKKITVSTVGFTDKIKNFADDITAEENVNLRKIKLALSLHSTDNGFRESIIPVSAKNRLPDIYEELVYFYRRTGSKITYEYIYFNGLNDTDNDIKRLVKLTRMVPSSINIIPFHPIDFKLNRPLDIFNKDKDLNKLLLNKNLFQFIEKLKRNKVTVNLRTSSGVDINAACGQLAVIKSQVNN
ncbi:MAG TPA: 23S rRNA (adenine(2503)-C(2))-methyltransferase RlmN [Ignavibacteria bacterium]|nr:23S rRNA (adenine(2503)-C(2))-methyltransferase RlmN [Ignavibacteria bacterium]HRJ99628.1 23S rRNA (adenine(2503)-C(2))-methyltransferase RlmN [Ignavibacteria bacterium]